MKKFFCLLFITILLGSLFILPVYAVDLAADANLIPAGVYYLNDSLSDFSWFATYNNEIYVNFRAGSSLDNLYSFNCFRFFNESQYGGDVLRFEYNQPRPFIYLNNTGYISNGSNFRYVVFDSDFRARSQFVTWFLSNTTLVVSDPGEHILSFFGSIVDFFSTGVQQVIPMFFSQNLTVFGYILLLMLSVPVIFILISFLNRFLNFR